MRWMKKLTSISLCAALITGSAVFASADARDTYVSMGADLTVEQRAKVLEAHGSDRRRSGGYGCGSDHQ